MESFKDRYERALASRNSTLSHSGVGHDDNPPGRGSGRYGWGTGKRPFQGKNVDQIISSITDRIGKERLDNIKKDAIRIGKKVGKAMLKVGGMIVIDQAGTVLLSKVFLIPAVQRVLKKPMMALTRITLNVAKNILGIKSISGVPLTDATIDLATLTMEQTAETVGFWKMLSEQLYATRPSKSIPALIGKMKGG